MICDKRKSLIVSDNVIQAEGLGDFFKNLGKVSSKAAKKLAKNALKNPSRLLEIGANIATAAAIRDFESYLRIVVNLDEEDIQLVLRQYKSNIVAYE